MAQDEQKPVAVGELAARLAAARKETVAGIARPVERPVFRTAEDGAVLLRDGSKLKEST